MGIRRCVMFKIFKKRDRQDKLSFKFIDVVSKMDVDNLKQFKGYVESVISYLEASENKTHGGR
jgi:hypothetical protein